MSTARRPWWALALAALVGLLLLGSPLNAWLSRPLVDWQLRQLAPTQTAVDVVVFDIDDRSLSTLKPSFGTWPFKRDVYALVIEQLRELGVRAIAIDLLMADSHPGDLALARALARPGAPVLLAAAGLTIARDDALPVALPVAQAADSAVPAQQWPTLALPAVSVWPDPQRPPLLGVVTSQLDDDGVLRRLPLWHQAGTRRLPSMPWAVYDAIDRAQAQAQPVLDRQGAVHLAFPPPSAQPQVRPFTELAQVALGQAPADGLRAAVQGRVVFIGSSALLADFVMTTQGQMSGTAALAQVYSTLRQAQWLQLPSPRFDALLLLLALLPLTWVVWRGRVAPRQDAAAFALALVALVAVAAYGQLQLRMPGQWAAPLITLLVGLLLAGLLHQRAVAARQRQLAHELAVTAEAAQAKSTFLANISHEMRTPLNALLGVAELLADSPLDATQRQHVQVFRDAGRALHDLINDLLDLSKIEAHRFELDRQPFSLHHSLQHLAALLRPRAESKGLRLRVALAADLPDGVLGDRHRVEQGTLNLLGNAIKFTHQGEVLLQARPNPDATGEVLIEVVDSGIGIAPSKLDAIFEPFAQADGSITRVYGGTGLGLALTRSVATLMGGAVSVRSRPGEGSVFALRLPLPAADLPAEAAAPQVQALAALEVPLAVLLAEDNEVNEYIFRAMVQGQPITLEVAPNGPTALDLLRRRRYDLAFLDVQMPGMDGLSVTRELRRLEADSGRPRTPVVALTANAYASDVQASIDAGCDRHLAKPFAKSQLIDALAQLGAAARQQSPARGAAPDLHLLSAAAPAIDAGSGIGRAGGDAARFERVAEHATVFTQGWQDSFDQAQGDRLRQRGLAHDLIDVALSLGAQDLAAHATALQWALDHGAEQPAAVAEALARVKSALTPVIAALTLRQPRH